MTQQHPDIGKRVKWRKSGETGFGRLVAMDDEIDAHPYLMQMEDGRGYPMSTWTHSSFYSTVLEQGVSKDAEHLEWVSSYELADTSKKVSPSNHMTLDELQNQPKYARVFASNFSDKDDAKAMIGGEYEVSSEHYADHIVILHSEDKNHRIIFNRSDVQFLTPAEFEKKKIGIGDEVQVPAWGWCVVYDCFWFDGAWTLAIVEKSGSTVNDCHYIQAHYIAAHRPPTALDPAKSKWEEEGKKNGWLT